jgi:hypothetical protein
MHAHIHTSMHTAMHLQDLHDLEYGIDRQGGTEKPAGSTSPPRNQG